MLDYIKILTETSKDQDNLTQYLKLISAAKSKKRKRCIKTSQEYVYYEEHHILPKSLFPEFNKIKENKVLLLPEEHFIAHKLLVSIFPGQPMAHAFWRMTCCTKDKKIITPEDYALARKLIKQYPPVGYIPDKNECMRRSNCMKDSWKQGKIVYTKEAHDKSVETRKANGSYIQTSEQKALKSQKMIGRIFVNNGIINKRIYKEELNEYLALGWNTGRVKK